MDIFSLMDCEGCPGLKRTHGRSCGDPDSCFLGEDSCSEGAPDDGPCERMLGVIKDLIYDGELDLYAGCIHAGGCLADAQKHNELEDMDLERWQGFDFSPAPYWFFPDGEKQPVPFEDEKAVFEEFFC
jgi:hypothetical protein